MKPFNPKSTIFTNDMLDIIMPSVPPNAWKILCFAMRKTAGWKDDKTESGRKESDVISISQFMKGCGIASNNTVMEAIDCCVKAGYLLREPDGQSYRYRLNIDYEITCAENAQVVDSTSAKNAQVISPTHAESAQTNNKSFNNKDLAREKYLEKVEARKKETEESIRKFNEKPSISNVNNYPEDVRYIIEKVCVLWSLTCPPIKSKQGGYWIEGGRDLITACEGHPDVVLNRIKNDLSARSEKITIASPNSLVQLACAKVGELKESAIPKEYVPPIGAWIGGVQYMGDNK